MAELGNRLRGKCVVVYCQKGLKISESAAAILRAHGAKSEELEYGQFAWRDAGRPMVEASKIPTLNADGQRFGSVAYVLKLIVSLAPD